MLYPNSDTAVEVHALTASSGSRVIRVDKDGTLAGTKTSSTDYSSSSISPDLQSYHVVFSAPPSRWWADVRFACSTIPLCTTRAEAEAWHRRHGFYEGDVMSLATLWGLAKVSEENAARCSSLLCCRYRGTNDACGAGMRADKI